jgi:pyridinium-3,5-biscarboxylic acid mononucleotide sulfurtransferase
MDAQLSDATSRTLELERSLIGWFRAQGSVAIGFSGGVDSTYLAAVAVDAVGADRTLAIIGRSASYPESQWRNARTVAASLDIPVLEIDTDELADPRYAANPTNRCYFCKTELWTKLAPAARARTLAVLVDGTNADDLHDHRPGAAAAHEHGVRSPLAEIGMTKAQIRERSQARGLPTWSQPASPCLASRIPYGTTVTSDRLRRIERAESALRALGVSGNLRVRDHGELGRVEMDSAELDRLMDESLLDSVAVAVRSAGFARAAVDLAGFRSGSLNVLEGVVAQ